MSDRLELYDYCTVNAALNNSNIRSISCIDNNLVAENLKDFIIALKHHQEIECLEMEGTNYSDEGIDELANFLISTNHIKKFSILCSSDSQLTKILSALKDNTSVKSLSIRTYTIFTPIINGFIDLFENNNRIKSFSIISDQQNLMEELLEYLGNKNTLTTLAFGSDCYFVPRFVIGDKLTYLKLCAPTPNLLEHVFDQLQNNTTLTKILFFNGHLFDNNDHITFLDFFNANSTIATLKFSNFYFNSKLISDILVGNKYIKKLSIANYRIDQSVIEHLSIVLKHNRSLAHLTLVAVDDEIDPVDGEALFTSLKTNTYLEFLNIAVKMLGLTKLAEALRVNHTLRQIDLTDKGRRTSTLNPYELEAISKALKKNYALESAILQ